MVAPLDVEAARYNALYAKGMNLIRGRIRLDKKPLSRFVSPWDRWQLRRGVVLFRRALVIAPRQWQCYFWIGKALQRLGDSEGALKVLEMARSLVPGNPTVAKEMANVAMSCGQPSLAVALLRPATDHAPRDASLWHNLALALLLIARPDEAHVSIQKSLALDSDESSQWLAALIADVRVGRRSLPASLAELEFSRF